MNSSSSEQQGNARVQLRAFRLSLYFWPCLATALVLFPAAWYGLKPLAELHIWRALAIISLPLLGGGLYLLFQGIFLASFARSFGRVNLTPAEQQTLEEALKLCGPTGELEAIYLLDAPGLALLWTSALGERLLLSTHSLRQLGERQVGMLLRQKVLFATQQSGWPWRLFKFSCFLAAVPPLLHTISAMPENVQQANLLICFVAGVVAMRGSLILMEREKERRSDKLAADEFGMFEYSEALAAWAAHASVAHGTSDAGRRIVALARPQRRARASH